MMCRTCPGSWLMGVAGAGLIVGGLVGFTSPEPGAPKPASQPAEKPAHKPTDKPKDAPAEQPKTEQPKEAKVNPAYVLDTKVGRMDGTSDDLAIYKGKVVLIVNVASKCGFTPQYAGLEKLYESKNKDGLVVLGFPANDFGQQEPGSDKEIAEFCSSTYHVSFPIYSKIVVTGASAHPLYKKLAAQPAPIGGPPKWNFTKFLVNRSGEVVARYESAVKPDDPKLLAKIDELLAASAGAEPGTSTQK